MVSRSEFADFTVREIDSALDVHQKNIECLLEEAGTSPQVVDEVRRSMFQVKALARLGTVLGRAGA